ncbi:MAG: GMC family oxidoreductase N-terminal domain-containing protein [Spirochaetes bacterium]|jgi:choline dehydrogenase-like flavoprotein|nr:GMC family oxidoreductase N-terminal domain-containing protein [Spirochaetota bacterium]
MEESKYDYIIIGAGLCGLSLGKELSLKNKKVLLLEKGRWLNDEKFGSIPYATTFYDKASLAKSRQGFYIYRSFGVGGSSAIMCSNAVSLTKDEIDKIGLDIHKEIEESKDEYGVSCVNYPPGKASSKIMESANSLNYEMKLMPKFTGKNRCVSCGDCILGCKYKAKWTAVEMLNSADSEKIVIKTGFSVKRIIHSNGTAVGVEGVSKTYYSEKIIVAAGGLGTPVILQKSGIDAGNNLFIDFFNVTYGEVPGFNQAREVTMSVVSDKFHEKEGFIISPYVDNIVSLCPVIKFKDYSKIFKMKSHLGIMAKISDENIGQVYKNGKVDKEPTVQDLTKLNRGFEISKEILIKCGANPKTIFYTKPRGAHPGGTAAIGSIVDKNLETRIKNLYVCDASVLPYAPGLPPVLTLLGLTKWLAKRL